jgi:succinate dehydrogenase / fumarate reductase cytochrome b subunit
MKRTLAAFWHKYAWHHAGMTAHVIQRTTGVLLLLYLLLHVRTIHKLSESPQAFDQALALFRHPLFKLAEIGLLGVVILHALNGVRITILDFSEGQARQRQLWVLAVGIGLVLFLLGAAPMFLFSVWKVEG